MPIPLYFMTHAYFCFYHAVSNYCIRRTRRALEHKGWQAQAAGEAVVVFVLSYTMAFGETLTIAHFPYYSFSVGPARPLHGHAFKVMHVLWPAGKRSAVS